jgi:hypothetical protein
MARPVLRKLAAAALGTAAALAAGVLAPAPASALTPRVELVNVSTNLRADVMWASTADATGAFLWPDNTSASQLFDLQPIGGVWFTIKARHSGKCLMIKRNVGKIGNGTPLAQYPCTGQGYLSEQWKFVPMMTNCEANALCLDTGHRVIVNRYTGRCIDTANPAGRKPKQQAVLQLWDCIRTPNAWNADNQIWKIVDAATKKTVTQPH